MIEKLLGILPEHKNYLDSLQGKVLYVADWKDENNGGISFRQGWNHRGLSRCMESKRKKCKTKKVKLWVGYHR